MQTVYTVREVARLFGLKESRLRYWAQTGFVNPSGRSSGRRAYTFSDLVEIKAAKELLDAGIPLQRVRRNLQALRHALPDDAQPLSRLRVRSDGDELMIVEEQTALDPVSGQMLLDFEIEDLGQHVAQVLDIAQQRAERGRIKKRPTVEERGAISSKPGAEPRDPEREGEQATHSAYAWFLRGCGLDEDGDRDIEAIEAYTRAIDLDPGLAAAHTNLGNLHYRRSERSAALRCYEMACTLDPDQPEARYNLANIYEEEGDLDMAIAEYRRAIKLSPDFSDAHFNLALALEQVGGRNQAVKHWQHYLELTTPFAELESWRQLARRHLDRLQQPG